MSWSEKGGKDVQIVFLAYADLNQALAGGQIDAMCNSEPQSTQAISKGFGSEIVKPYDTPIGEPRHPAAALAGGAQVARISIAAAAL